MEVRDAPADRELHARWGRRGPAHLLGRRTHHIDVIKELTKEDSLELVSANKAAGVLARLDDVELPSSFADADDERVLAGMRQPMQIAEGRFRGRRWGSDTMALLPGIGARIRTSAEATA